MAKSEPAVMDAAKEQSAVVLAVRVDGVNDLHARAMSKRVVSVTLA